MSAAVSESPGRYMPMAAIVLFAAWKTIGTISVRVWK